MCAAVLVSSSPSSSSSTLPMKLYGKLPAEGSDAAVKLEAENGVRRWRAKERERERAGGHG